MWADRARRVWARLPLWLVEAKRGLGRTRGLCRVQTVNGPLRMEAQRAEAQRAKGTLRPWRQTHQAVSPVGGQSARRRGAAAAAAVARRAEPGVGQGLGRYAALCAKRAGLATRDYTLQHLCVS